MVGSGVESDLLKREMYNFFVYGSLLAFVRGKAKTIVTDRFKFEDHNKD